MATTLAPLTISPCSTERSLTTAERRVDEIRTDDNEKCMVVAFIPPGKNNRCPGGRVGSSNCACTATGVKDNDININRLDKIVFCLNTNPTLMKTQCMYRNNYR